jgi:hypothetical protein
VTGEILMQRSRRFAVRLLVRQLLVPACFAVILLFVGAGPTLAQSYSLYGDIQSYGIYNYLPDAADLPDRDRRDRYAFSAVARIQAQHRLSLGDVTFSAVHSLTGIGGSYARAAAEVIDAETRLSSGAWLPIHRVQTARAELFLGSSAAIRIGKQRMSWGVPRTFTPTDSLHPDGAVPTAQEGFVGISGDLALGPNLVLAGGINFDDALAEHTAGTADVADLPFYRRLRYAARASLFVFRSLELAPSVVFQEEQTARPGLGFSLPVGPVLFYGEGAAEFLNSRRYPTGTVGSPASITFDPADTGEPAFQAVAGVDWSSSWRALTLNLSGEYLYNGFGYSDVERTLLDDAATTWRRHAPVPGPAGVSALLGGGALGVDTGTGAALSGAPEGDTTEATGADSPLPPASYPRDLPALPARHYLLPQITLDIAGYLSLSGLAAVALDDGGVTAAQQLTVTPTGSLDVSLITAWTLDEVSARARLPGSLQLGLGMVLHF